MLNTLRRWDPWSELDRWQSELNRVFQGGGLVGRAAFPAVNVWRNDDKLVLTMELPGINLEDLDVTVEGEKLSISGKLPEEKTEEGTNWYRKERTSGSFSRTLGLPFEVDPQQTEATYQNGVLALTLVRPEAHRPKKVTVKPV